MYDFKGVKPVAKAHELIDTVLSKVMRKSATQVHPQFHITRVREFYMTKVRLAQTFWEEKLGQMVTDFPRLDDIHPFYSDLINVLYDRDHYKLALGQVNGAKNIITAIGKDYVRALKYADTAFRCKHVKRAALGRMCTVVRKHKAAFEYLEEVRKHLARLPAINPNTRTLLVCGFPNVGKSSFMNEVTHADVDVQPYAFTTKSLFVGHCDYRYVPWQVIDTPGILDKPLESRNTIEMQSITAMAHLQAAILFFLDISEACGHSVEEQCALFDSIRPLFAKKPLTIVCTKTDLQPMDTLDDKSKAMILETARAAGASITSLSNITKEGVMKVRNGACDMLLTARTDAKKAGSRLAEVSHRLVVTMPRPRDSRARPTSIPASVLRAKAAAGEATPATAADGEAAAGASASASSSSSAADAAPSRSSIRRLEVDLEREAGGPGVYSGDMSRHYLLAEEEWKRDVMPEIMDGRNVADFVDRDLLSRLEAIEAEEAVLEAQYAREQAAAASAEAAKTPLEKAEALAERGLAEAVRGERAKRALHSRLKDATNYAAMPRTVRGRAPSRTGIAAHLERLGMEADGAAAVAAAGPLHRKPKRGRSTSRRRGDDDDSDVDMDGEEDRPKRRRSKSVLKGVTAPREGDGFRDIEMKSDAVKAARRAQRRMQSEGRKGEGDRFIGDKMPKHLFSGKRGIGTTDWR